MADLEQLKGKYQSVLTLINQLGVRLQNLHVQDNKLFIKGTAKTKTDSNRIWDQIKLVDKNYSQDLMAKSPTKPMRQRRLPLPRPPRPTLSKRAIHSRRWPNSITGMRMHI
jgi:hypothetical protein